MPIQVKAPDGSIAEFPDGTSDDVITSVMAREYGGPKPAAAPAEPPSGSYFQGLTDQISPFNLGDEARALGRASGAQLKELFDPNRDDETFGQSYRRAKGEIDAQDAEFRSQNPKASLAANIAGGAVSGVATGGLGAGAGLLRATGINAAVGAGTGAVAGAGTGDSLEERARGAVAGGVLGGAVGAAAPVVAAGVGSAYRGARNMLGMQDPTKQATELLNRSLAREGLTADEAVEAVSVKRAQAPGSQPTLADTGDQTRRLLRTVETVPSAGSRQATEFVTERQRGMGDRLQAGIRGAVSGQNQNATEQALRQARQAASQPLYEQAFSHAPVHNDYVARMVQDPIVRQGIRRGLEVQRLEALAENRPFNPMDYAVTGFDDAGDPIMGAVPNMRLLDAAKRGLDDILEESRDPVTQRLRLDQRGRAVDQVRKSLVQTLDDLNPDYAAARAAWAGPSQSMSAMQSGRAFMKGDIEDMDIRLDDLAPADRDFFLIGLSRELRDMVDGRATDLSDATRRLMKPEVQERLSRILSPQQLGSLTDMLGVERGGARTYATTTGGSVTGRIAADQDDAGDIAARAGIDLLTQGPRSAGLNAASRLASRAKGLNEGTADELARMLTAWTPEDLARLRGRLSEAKLRELMAAARSRTAGRAALTGTTTAIPGAMEDRR